ncbi:Transcription initiation factor TFIIIB, Brf1 subunit/Transcription initiation factor TFIIB [Roseibacterium elongatum DSM 19469]|uniref:Transcription initiation factor TFIIIB, Brf1 subunit/Transcription initiation factor TFIIB n=1 Tax=Roseicyclus elongatus DSM 19469 TaxID=1294273 RepID=W8S5K1_9RHOB|nr:TIGR02300 family protein [Roseibacterium elongatum]AHM04111.1 Transcription initiation factor TFIIIB, Brf1 subunit/Transcription initiation factor TFIIB [Roseibacterium elongatum DSM 19469]
MPKEEWGVKRVCPTTGKRFYDLNRDPIVSPYTGDVVVLDTGKGGRTLVADKADPKSAKKKAEETDGDDLVIDDDLDIEDDSDVEIEDDDVLDDDDDSDTVALDDLADVASDDSDES